jgi:putative peptidoglycan lipid II flippase
MRSSVRDIFASWNGWRVQTASRRIFAATVTVGSLASLVKIAGAAKLIVISHKFGTGDPVDAFLIALLLPMFLAEVLGGSFHAAFVPVFIEIREHQGRVAAQHLLSAVMARATLLLFATAILLALSGHWILPLLASGFGAAKLSLAGSLFHCLLPVLILSGLSIIGRAILNAGERFALAALAPIATPLVTIVLLAALARQLGPYALALGALGGSLLELLAVCRALRRHGFSLFPGRRSHPAIRRVMSQYGPVVAGGFLTSGSIVVDQSLAATLGPGSVSALNYGSKLVLVLLSIASGAISTAVLPHFSRIVALGDWTALRQTLKTYSRVLGLVTIPLALVLMLVSEPLVRLLYQRGAFTEADTLLVAGVQRIFFLQVPFAIVSALFVRLLSSLKANQVLLRAAAISLPLNVILDVVFMRWLGVAGIALASAVVSLVSFSYVSYKALSLANRIAQQQAAGARKEGSFGSGRGAKRFQ